MSEPFSTRSPTPTRSSRTVPAAGEGMSMVALSDSTVISGSSSLTTSPGATWISMTGTSVKSPRSGTLTSVAVGTVTPWAVMPVTLIRAVMPGHTVDGSGLPISIPYREIASATVAAGIAASSAREARAARAT